MEFQNSLDFARRLDIMDELASFRDQFIIPEKNGHDQIYFLGNSLGLQPKSTSTYIQQILDEWRLHGVEGFFRGTNPWLQYHDQLVRPLSNLAGAQPAEVVVMNQLTVNLHLMMVSFYRPAGKRKKILCEAKAFPSDQYMFETHLKYLSLDPAEVLIEISPRLGEHTLRNEDILSAIDQHRAELALVLLGGVNYYTGQLLDMHAITKAGHTAGAYVGFDLAHAVGNVRLALHDWDVDFACWCSYKYLNSGPGGVAGGYIHERFHRDESLPRFAGWWGHDKQSRFMMKKGFKPIQTAEGWQLSTPSLLLFACHKAALEQFENAGFDKLLEKSNKLTNYLLYVLQSINKMSDTPMIEILTPLEDLQHGCQVSMLVSANGREIFQRLSDRGVFADWREPNVIRVAPVPLYNRFEEVWRFGEALLH